MILQGCDFSGCVKKFACGTSGLVTYVTIVSLKQLCLKHLFLWEMSEGSGSSCSTFTKTGLISRMLKP